MVNKSAMFNCFVPSMCALLMRAAHVVPLRFRAGWLFPHITGWVFAAVVGNTREMTHLNSLALYAHSHLTSLPPASYSWIYNNRCQGIQLSGVVINFTSPSWRMFFIYWPRCLRYYSAIPCWWDLLLVLHRDRTVAIRVELFVLLAGAIIWPKREQQVVILLKGS